MRNVRLSIPILFAFALGYLWASVSAQGSGGIAVGGVTLGLGMPEQEALARLGDRFELQRSSGTDNVSWMVRDKKLPVAQLVFRQQRLDYARIYWLQNGDAQAGGFALANAAYGILARHLDADRWYSCQVLVSSNQTPDGQFKALNIACPVVRLEMSTSSVAKFGDSASVEEVHERGRKP